MILEQKYRVRGKGKEREEKDDGRKEEEEKGNNFKADYTSKNTVLRALTNSATQDTISISSEIYVTLT